MFSDGYADQLGGEEGNEKYMYPRFRSLLLEIHQQDGPLQKQALDESFNAWRKGVEQIDDVMVMGFRV